ncbi:MAG TPA: hypothetical protein VJ998_02515, partial [Pseudomonadales bacterium]|nr:hypothetical protein [Pseudomonadales bacterium]
MDWQSTNIADAFQPGVRPSSQGDESYHIVISDGEILSIDNTSPWRPLDQDEFRWLGLEVV